MSKVKTWGEKESIQAKPISSKPKKPKIRINIDYGLLGTIVVGIILFVGVIFIVSNFDSILDIEENNESSEANKTIEKVFEMFDDMGFSHFWVWLTILTMALMAWMVIGRRFRGGYY